MSLVVLSTCSEDDRTKMFNWWWNLVQSDQLDDQRKETDALRERIVQLEARCEVLEQWIKYLDEVKK